MRGMSPAHIRPKKSCRKNRKLQPCCTKSTKGRSRPVVLPFVLFVPFVANFFPHLRDTISPDSCVRFGQQPLRHDATHSTVKRVIFETAFEVSSSIHTSKVPRFSIVVSIL